VERATSLSKGLGVVVVVLVAWLVVVAVRGSAESQTKIVEIGVYVVVASMWNLLAGFTGLVSIGQQAFVGLGAYAVVVAVNGHGMNIYLAILPAAAVALVASVPIALLAFRLRGAYFAVGMWVIAEVVRLLVKQYKDDPIKGGSGTSLEVPTSLYPKDERYQVTALIALGLAVVAVSVVALLLRSRMGLSLQAVRDDEAGAGGLGVNVYRERFVAFMVAALLTGAAGAVWYLLKIRIQPDTAFGVADWTAPIVVMVVVGGLGTIEGPVIGAVVWYLLRDYLTDDGSALHVSDEWYLIVTGMLTMVMALYARRGLWGSLQHRVPNLQVFPVRRRLIVGEGVDDG
jgi:branched-chain amino acid transport system permease protein